MRLLDHPVISERYFFPRRASLPGATVIDVDGASLACADLGGDGPVLLHFHGNGEVVSDWLSDFGPGLKSYGYAPFFAEYRGYGDSTGRPMLDTMLDDALAVFDALPEGHPVVVYGRSVGSLYALHVAAHRTVAALVIESGIADIHQRLAIRMHPGELGTTDADFRAALAERFDHQAKVQAHRGPLLILHTTHDHMVDVEHARTLASWAGESGELIEFAEGDHNSIFAYNGPDILEILGGLRSEITGAC